MVPVLANDDRLLHLLELLDLAVDLGRADAHPAWVQRGVRPPVDDHAAMLGPLGEVAVMPDVGEAREVGGAILLLVRVIPKPHGHRGERALADELALASSHRRAALVNDVDGET